MREIKPENFRFKSHCKEVFQGRRALLSFGFDPNKAKLEVDDRGSLHISQDSQPPFQIPRESWEEVPPPHS